MKLEQFVEQAHEAFQEKLQAIVLYGDGVDVSNPKGGYELLVLLHDLSPETLIKGSALARRWMADENPEPLFIDEIHIQSSLDVFPMEFADIKECHKILWGQLDLSKLQIDKLHLRLQCEREIKEKVLAIRERFIALHPKARPLSELVTDSAPDILRIFRGLLRLQALPVPEHDTDLIKATAEVTQIDMTYLHTSLRLRRENGKIASDDLIDFFGGYLTCLEKVASLIDKL